MESVRALLAEYGRTPSSLHVQQLKSWWTNLVLLVAADGERLVLRCYGTTPPEEVWWELALLSHLRAHDFPTIRPLTRVDGSALSDFAGRPAVLYPYVEGQNAGHGGVDRLYAMAETAALVGRLNRLTTNLSLPHPRVRSGANSRRLLAQLRDWLRERGIAPHERRLAEFAAHAEAALGELDARLAPCAATLPSGIVHHDAHYNNVLFRGAELVALIDFDDACPGYLVTELPVMIDNWATDGETDALIPDQVRAIIAAYHRTRPLTPAERDLLPAFHLVYILGNTAADVFEQARHGHPPEQVLAESHGYRRYHRFAVDPTWRTTLDRALDVCSV